MTGRDLSQLDWRKSTLSGGADEDSSCIEVAPMRDHGIAARDSKDPHGPVLHFTADEWTAFLTRIKQDRLS
ncbi:DUF397 domain-containing protein [Actinomadura bangladeshensis]|uniref:DUF397 domain-containing protein n=1 Tax=Actinomadura bangladeshensis TaxID=453573 RepID=A0A6L9QCK7_9ACTN|nr:DUF397 domain-containing protein [Actinomadura bangladeshensis]NEA21934.1 DUF397 domain-containing protein [Actinomadura bangladeshensis]